MDAWGSSVSKIIRDFVRELYSVLVIAMRQKHTGVESLIRRFAVSILYLIFFKCKREIRD